ncbi:MAG: acetamidase/formamidase family protein [Gammaproteobacteria bacterium]|nr:acetamidase/formamidase family protein [Gammaproteobacteria bacterium]
MNLEKRLFQWIGIVSLSALLASAAQAQSSGDENYLPYLSGPLDQASMVAPHRTTHPTSKTYILPATPATSQWGVFDNSQPPVLTINSGDSVAIETSAASDNQVVPGTTVKQIIQMQKAVPERGPHTLTGPIYVNGAEPGDVLRIHINKIVPRAYASNDSVPGKGLFPQEFPNGFVKYFYLDVKNKKMQFAPGIVVPLAPFPGIVAVAQATPGKFDSGPPGRFGGNMDLRELTEGSTLYLPVFVKGGLVWTGDSHAGQGNGEIDLTAIETAFAEFNVTIDVIKHKSLKWPRVETPTHWIAVGYDENLNKALDILKDETTQLIMDQYHVSQAKAQQMMLNTWNCPISEVVNGVQGVYCMIPKDAHATHPIVLPKTDNSTYFVTYAKDPDLHKAMSIASMSMLNKIVAAKKLSRIDAYMLASFTMDCRMGPYQSGDKEVHCMMPKSLWTS